VEDLQATVEDYFSSDEEVGEVEDESNSSNTVVGNNHYEMSSKPLHVPARHGKSVN